MGTNKHSVTIVFAILILVAVPVASAQRQSTSSAGTRSDDPVLLGAADGASCPDLAGAYATSKLIEKIPGAVFVAGDLAYPDGSDENFAKCYQPTWGRFMDRTRPAPGNHEYHSDGASGCNRYFGAAAGDLKNGY